VRFRFRVPRCSLLDIAALMVPLWLVVLASHTGADADLWGHLRFGLDFLAGKGLPSTDPYSFTSDIQWVNHEWLSEVILAAAFTAGGALLLNLLKLAVIVSLATIVWRAARHAGATPQCAVVLTSLVVLASYTRTQVLRPQLFSVLVFAVLLEVLDRSAWNSRRRLVAIPLLFALWTNLHGAWIVGYAALGAWLAAEACEERSLSSAIRTAVVGVAAAAATAANPYGFGQWAFLRQTVGFGRDISDWAPLLQLPTAIVVLDLILPAIAILSLVCRQTSYDSASNKRADPLRPRPHHAAVVGILGIATWRIGRVDAFLQVATGLLFAPSIVDFFTRVAARLSSVERLRTTSVVNGLAASAAVISVCLAAMPRLANIVIEGSWAPDYAAITFLRTESRGSKLLTWFDWGEYAIWHLSPAGIRVSMDGRRETVYSDRVLADHWAFYWNEGAWDYPDRIGADRIWVPKRLPVTGTLVSRGWHVAFESDRSIIFSREPGQPLLVVSRDGSVQSFPGQ
jgi:hypothetical protein